MNILRRFFVVLSTPIMLVAMTAAPVSAATGTIYNNIPSPQPSNLPSQAFEATSTSEFGGQVMFGGTARQNPKVTVLMSSWGCQNGNWYSNNCVTTPGSSFTEDITLNIYNVNPDNSPGPLIKAATHSFSIPFRPSASAICGDGRWSDGTACFNGLATPISFDLNGQGVTLPNKAIISVAYNTSHYGYVPKGQATACYITSGGCGYDSLNVAVTAPPTTGSDPLPNDAYINSSATNQYCPGTTGTIGTFSLDTGCWTGSQPAIRVEVNLPSKDDCKNNGWKSLTNPGPFKNQGDCVSYFATNGKNLPNGQ